jgi:hypothetical protein
MDIKFKIPVKSATILNYLRAHHLESCRHGLQAPW